MLDGANANSLINRENKSGRKINLCRKCVAAFYERPPSVIIAPNKAFLGEATLRETLREFLGIFVVYSNNSLNRRRASAAAFNDPSTIFFLFIIRIA